MLKNCHLYFSDLCKLYMSKELDPKVSPQTLQDKVQFDIRFYFIHRANENIDKFTKETFTLCIDANTGLKYIKKQIDEQTKNHQDDTTFVNGIMPEDPNSDLCPVKNFMFYKSKVHPRCDFLRQQVKEEHDFTDLDIWYKPLKIGENPLAAFMSCISHAADLSRVYTNHSICVTGTTFLGRSNFSDKQIMSVTGHRSINSLSVYKKVSDQEKIQMGQAISAYLQSDAPQQGQILHVPTIAIGAPPQVKAIENQQNTKEKENTNREVVQYEPEGPLLAADFNEDLDFDVGSILNEIENNNIQYTQRESSTSMTVQKQTIRRSPNVPIFQNCKIGSIGIIHLHIHKN